MAAGVVIDRQGHRPSFLVAALTVLMAALLFARVVLKYNPTQD
jgi:hypothetical protein